MSEPPSAHQSGIAGSTDRLAAYWVLIIVSVGMRWSMILAVTSGRLRSNVRTAVLRTLAAAIAAYGIHSSLVLGIGSRLMAEITPNVRDFGHLGSFSIASIMALYALHDETGK